MTHKSEHRARLPLFGFTPRGAFTAKLQNEHFQAFGQLEQLLLLAVSYVGNATEQTVSTPKKGLYSTPS